MDSSGFHWIPLKDVFVVDYRCTPMFPHLGETQFFLPARLPVVDETPRVKFARALCVFGIDYSFTACTIIFLYLGQDQSLSPC